MRGSYTGYMARNATYQHERDAKETSDLYDAVQSLLQSGATVSYGVVQVTGVEYVPGTRELIVYSNGASVTLHRESMGFYELRTQVRRLLQEQEGE